jgi:hypothetical protein
MISANTGIRSRRGSVGTELSDFAFRIPKAQRDQMQAIAEHRGWSEAEAMRRAVSLFLTHNENLLQVLRAGNGATDASDH